MDPINLNKIHVLKPSQYNNNQSTPAEVQQKFAESLKSAINNLNDSQVKSSKVTDAFVNGKIDNLHDVMIASQQASVTRTMAVEVRNKAVEAYKEIMRMQI